MTETTIPAKLPHMRIGAAAAAAYADAKIRFLTELIDEYDRITGRTQAAVIPAETWEAFRQAVSASSPA